MNLHEIDQLCREFKSFPERRSIILDFLRKKGQGRIADQLLADWNKNNLQCAPVRIKKKGFFASLAGALADTRYREDKKNIESIKKIMLESISAMIDINLTEEGRVIALKNFEESRSTLEDTAKNFPDERVRKLAFEAAQQVLNSKKAKEFLENQKQQNQGHGLGRAHPGVMYLGDYYGQPSWM